MAGWGYLLVNLNAKEHILVFNPCNLYLHSKVIKGDPDIQAPVTIPHFLKRTFDRFPNDPALSWKDEEDLWQSLTYAQYKKLIYNVAKSFLKVKM